MLHNRDMVIIIVLLATNLPKCILHSCVGNIPKNSHERLSIIGQLGKLPLLLSCRPTSLFVLSHLSCKNKEHEITQNIIKPF